MIPSPVPPLDKGTLNLPKVMEHSVECSLERGTFLVSLSLSLSFDEDFFQVFRLVSTDDGFCCSFNIIPSEDLSNVG